MGRSFARRGLERVKGILSSGAPAPFSVEVTLAGGQGNIECEFGDIFCLEVDLENTGNTALDSRRIDHPDYLSYHWRSGTGEMLDHEGLRTESRAAARGSAKRLFTSPANVSCPGPPGSGSPS